LSFTKDALTILGKDVRIELRTRELIVTMGFFAVLVAVICSLAFFVDERTGRQVAPGVLWVAIAFSGSLGLVRAFGREREEQAFVAILLSPVSRGAIFVGKAMSSLLFLLVTEAIVLPVVGILFHLDLAPIALPLALVMLLGTAGYAMAATVFGAVVATRELFGGATLAQVADWLKLLFVMDLLMLVGSLWVFDPLMQD
jgi:heme exporter protein B